MKKAYSPGKKTTCNYLQDSEKRHYIRGLPPKRCRNLSRQIARGSVPWTRGERMKLSRVRISQLPG